MKTGGKITCNYKKNHIPVLAGITKKIQTLKN
jgi:hypothetical protein